jgi:hypothetical protein
LILLADFVNTVHTRAEQACCMATVALLHLSNNFLQLLIVLQEHALSFALQPLAMSPYVHQRTLQV